MIVLGIDPGGASTGLAIVDTRGNGVGWHALVERDRTEPLTAYLEAIADEVASASDTALDLVALEDLTDPSPHLGLANVRGLIDTATVTGWILGVLRYSSVPVTMVAPGEHGSAPIGAYPEAIRSPRERVGAGRLRHVRSAYDVAIAGARQARHPAAFG